MSFIRAWTLVACLLLIANRSAEASSIGVSSTQTTNIEKLGWPTNYTITGTIQGLSISNVSWTVRQVGPNASNSFSMTGSDINSSLKWSIPGTFEIKAIITYMGNQQNPNPNPETITRSVTIDTAIITVTLGLDTNTPYNDDTNIPTATSLNGSRGRYLVFRLTLSDGSNPGPYIGFYAQEFNTAKFGEGISLPPDSDWTPTDNNDVRFQINRNPDNENVYILDWKTTTIPVGQGSPRPGGCDR